MPGGPVQEPAGALMQVPLGGKGEEELSDPGDLGAGAGRGPDAGAAGRRGRRRAWQPGGLGAGAGRGPDAAPL